MGQHCDGFTTRHCLTLLLSVFGGRAAVAGVPRPSYLFEFLRAAGSEISTGMHSHDRTQSIPAQVGVKHVEKN